MPLPRSLFLVLALLVFAQSARSEPRPAPVFTDNMVLQRSSEIPIWGTADPGEHIYVFLKITTKDGSREEGKNAIADKEGKWSVKLGKFEAGTEGTLLVRGDKDEGGLGQKKGVAFKNVAVGDVWICSGQSNMEMGLASTLNRDEAIKNSANPNIRLFTVNLHAALEPMHSFRAADTKEAWKNRWVLCGPDQSGHFSAVGYFFGKALQEKLGVPIGLIHTSWGGTPAEAWTSYATLRDNSLLKHYADGFDNEVKKVNLATADKEYAEAIAKWTADAEQARKDNKPLPPEPAFPAAFSTKNPHTPTSLYNGMIYPLLPYAIKGAIWYQGESNADRAEEYRTLFPAMIEDWRKQWGHEFPFFCVQLAPYAAGNKPDGPMWAELREAQTLATTKLKGVGMAVITDYGDAKDIHPKQKQPVGERLALAARAIAYGEKIEYSGPVNKSMKVDGNKATLTFEHLGGGLVAKGNDGLTGFSAAGGDHVFVPVSAKIEGENVVVSSDKIDKIEAVRFGWANMPVVNLFNKEGLPAVPFRTDDYPLTTTKKK